MDRTAMAFQERRLRRRAWVRALLIAAILTGSVGTLWYFSLTESVTRSEWAFQLTQVGALQAAGIDGSGRVVCLVDTGIDTGHPDLAAIPMVAWHDFVHGRATPYDDGGHGTAMAGLLAARGTMLGVAPGAALIVAKALDSHGRGISPWIASAIDFCSDPNRDGNASDAADVISLSLAGATNLTVGSELLTAVDRALGRGIFIVASAGNDGMIDDGDVQSPASIDGVLAVGSVTEFGTMANFSSVGAEAGRTDPNRKPELVAPGVRLLTTARGGGYQVISGTSASAAFVSGVVALLLASHPALARSGQLATVTLIKTALMETALKMEGQQLPHDPHSGYGIIAAADANAALG